MLSARCCSRRDCSVFRVGDAIESFQQKMNNQRDNFASGVILSAAALQAERRISRGQTTEPVPPRATDHYSSARAPEFIRYSSFCNPYATSPHYPESIKLPF
jgi:hypothetical protein